MRPGHAPAPSYRSLRSKGAIAAVRSRSTSTLTRAPPRRRLYAASAAHVSAPGHPSRRNRLIRAMQLHTAHAMRAAHTRHHSQTFAQHVLAPLLSARHTTTPLRRTPRLSKA
ncbi:unnamed protein product [Chondrus crispus]|uniref:Uncharacterized protein n=1 Tax=Chondrus crispus TaxID=2769 RepID=S0F3U6_CHOCR|nr:unnamed protein product [Chondrus crispus]CDF77448.1 unnamed protein product [Chondrus crispus]|eukprot:XP_005712322.1 unnamed protein product [Chondrus crispus]